MGTKFYIKVSTRGHVTEMHVFDSTISLPSGVIHVPQDPFDFRDRMDPHHIMLWNKTDGFSSVDVESDEGIEAMGINVVK